MATFYFNGADGFVWTTLGSWWMDAAHTIPATALPTSADSVVMSELFLITDEPQTVVDCVFINSSFMIGGPLAVTGNCVFNDYSEHVDGTITGNCAFNDYSQLGSGTITGNCTFNDSSRNDGTITGDCTFNHSSYNDYGTINGNCTFNDSSYNDGTINGNCTFNDSSYNTGTVSGSRSFQNRTPYPIPRGINGSSILGVI